MKVYLLQNYEKKKKAQWFPRTGEGREGGRSVWGFFGEMIL